MSRRYSSTHSQRIHRSSRRSPHRSPVDPPPSIARTRGLQRPGGSGRRDDRRRPRRGERV